MYRIIGRQPWTCRRCLLRLRTAEARRKVSSTAAPFPSSSEILKDYGVSHSTSASTQRHDDSTLRQVFDSRPFWREFSLSSQRRGGNKRAGLLQNQYLTDPEGFRQFAQESLQKCQRVVAKVLDASTLEDFRVMVRDLDQLSDLLCRVVDIADFMRANHPERAWQEAGAQAFALMFEYMNVLNTTPRLNELVKRAAADPEVASHWSQEEKAAAQVLLRDFANSAIDLPPQERQRFVRLSSEISQLGPEFARNGEPETSELMFDKNRLWGLDPTVIKDLTRWMRVAVPTSGPVPRMALGSVRDEQTRKEIYVANRTASRPQLQRLEALLQKRAELAKLTGSDNYAQMTLKDKMARSPEAVVHFLTSLNASHRSKVDDELSKLLALKQLDSPSATRLQPWDHAYYADRHATTTQRRPSRRSREAELLPSFFSLGTVMQGLSRLFTKLYGVRFVAREPDPGETWHPDVRRLDVLDESDTHIAVIYCDLFSRPGKIHNAAHFTLRGSRKISAAEVAESAAGAGPLSHPNDGMATAAKPGTDELYQIPTIALLCDFDFAEENQTHPRGSTSSAAAAAAAPPSLLTARDVEVLFHEMGHAIHSVLGRTELQLICGTRCATDFAELPSVLMENFATCPAVLSLFARHWATDEPLPEEMMRNLAAGRHRSDGQDEEGSNTHGAVDDETQIVMALLDQAYHSLPSSLSSSGPGPIDTTAIFRDVTATHSSLPDPPDTHTAWQGYFSHLFTYGGTYYSYLFDRAIAHKVWTDVFDSGAGSGAISREAGSVFRDEVLRWGGGRDGWRCVAGALGKAGSTAAADGRLAEGGADAMREVGRWGLQSYDR